MRVDEYIFPKENEAKQGMYNRFYQAFPRLLT